MEKAPGAICDECPLRRAPMAKSQLATAPEFISCNDTRNTEGSTPRRGRTAHTSSVRVAIISRSPGIHDTRANRPFAGPSGKLLEHLLSEHGVLLKDCYVSNVVLCMCEKVPKEAIDCCSPRLERELKEFDPTIILACGTEAAHYLLKKRGKIDSLRGVVHDTEYGPVVVTNNPAAAIRNADVYPNLVSDFRRAFNPPAEFKPPMVYYTEDVEDIPKFFKAMEFACKDNVIAADVETSGLRYGSRLLVLGFSPDPRHSFVFGRDLLDSYGTIRDRAYEQFDNFFTNPRYKFVWHNGQFDTKILRSWGIEADVHEDTQLLHACLDERSKLEYHSLDYCLQDLLGWPDYTPEKIKVGKKNSFVNILPDEWPEVYQYNGYDCTGTRQLYDYLKPLVEIE